MRIGILGGTFNPPHKTHIDIAKQAIANLQLDKLLVIPCGQPPHKFCGVSKEHRLAMTKLAFDSLPVEIDTYEMDKEGLSYSLDTVKYVIDKYNTQDIFFIIGGDSLRDIDSWHCPEQLTKLVTLVVAERGGIELNQAIDKCKEKYNANIVTLNIPVTQYSSTDIRLKYQFGYEVCEVPQCVDSYIKANNLFCEYREMTAKLHEYLTPQRYSHTFYVVKAGLQLKSKCSQEDIFVACALHDCAKYITKEQYYKYNFVNDQDLPEPVVHAFLGAIVARVDFGVTNQQILDAIKYHTTARPDMTELDMVVYVADKIEQSRPYPTEHLIKDTLVKTFLATLKEAYQVCVDRHRQTSPLTEQAIEYYQKQLTKE